MLTCSLDSRSSIPLYEQLYQFIRQEIENGRLKPNEKLPSKRKLYAHLKVSQNTVETAYSQLVAEGYLYAKPRSGYYVQAIEPRLPAKKQATNRAIPKKIIETLPALRYDFKTNKVDTNCFPFSTWAKLTRNTLYEDDRTLLNSVHPQGDTALRIEIARYLRDFRGIHASPEQIVIGAGSEYLLGLVIQLLGRNCVYAIENPGYPKIQKIFKSNDVRTAAIELDKNGICPNKLRQSDANVVHVTPSHHFPLGIIMPVARRRQLLQWADEKAGRYILEDDYDSEFRFSGRPIPALQGLDSNGRVIYFNTFAKSLAPSLRISYMVLPEPLLMLYQRNFSFYSSTVPSIEQHTLRRFIHNGYFERHLNRMRNLYKARRDTLLEQIARHDPHHKITVYGQDTGLHVLLHVNNGMSEKQLVETAHDKGVGVYGLSSYCSEPVTTCIHSQVVIGYAGFPPEEMANAIKLLAQAWKLQ